MWLDTLEEKHYKVLYEIHKRVEKFYAPTFMQFQDIMKERNGFVVVTKNGELAGTINFGEYIPEMDITIFGFIDFPYRKKWASRTIGKIVFDYPFEYLNLPRITGYTVKGINDDDTARFLKALGFKYEGTMRKKLKMLDDNLYDIEIYSLLREERKW